MSAVECCRRGEGRLLEARRSPYKYRLAFATVESTAHRPGRGCHLQKVSLLLVEGIFKEGLHVRAHSGDCDLTHD